MDMTFKLQVFEGPLDLLLYLIEKNKVNIYDIPIVEITAQYMEYVNQMKKDNLDTLSEFLVMAATLLDIKSKMLLPKKEEEEQEQEDPRAELVQQLLEYKMYKCMANELKDRQLDAGKVWYKKKDIPDEVLAYEEPVNLEELVGDIRLSDLNRIFQSIMKRQEEKIDSCIHFAGLKAVGESVAKPWEYYNNNIAGTLTLVDVMRQNGCKSIIFSSSATVYGDPAQIPITEECPKGQCTNPYGWTKSMLEQILMDIYKADNEWNVILLRYFNPIGAHKSGTMGENPNGIPNNLMPYITQVAVGKLKELGVFGDDYDTPDGTGVRDYIHVVDLAVGHVKALKKIEENAGLCIYNLGTGHGYSVLDIVKNFEAATGVKIPYTIKPRRPGDIATCYCDPSKAKRELGWEAQYGIKEMCADSWRWQKNNPNGYDD